MLNPLHSTYYSLTVLQFVDFLLALPPAGEIPPAGGGRRSLEKIPSGQKAWLRGGAVHGSPNEWLGRCKAGTTAAASARQAVALSVEARVLSPSGSRGEGRPLRPLAADSPCNAPSRRREDNEMDSHKPMRRPGARRGGGAGGFVSFCRGISAPARVKTPVKDLPSPVVSTSRVTDSSRIPGRAVGLAGEEN